MLLPMLAEKYDGKPLRGECIAEPKLDGVRALWFNSTLWGRSKKPEGVALLHPRPIIEELKTLPWCALDGEVYAGTWGRTMTAKSGTDEEMATYYVFDIMELDGQSLIGLPLSTRRTLLSSVLDPIDGLPHIKQLRPYSFGPYPDPMLIARELVAKGYEGTMIKRLSAPYLPGVRSTEWIKVKIDKEVDAVICGAEPGKAEGRLAGTLGALLVETGDGKRFKVGTKMTDAERQRLWKMYESGDLLGRMVTVSHQEDANIVGRFPKLIRLREDF